MTEEYLQGLTDEELVLLHTARGRRDDRPFREILRRYQSMVWRVCYGIVHNGQDAEDITQEVFFKVYRNLTKFEGRSALKTWIYRIAINTSQNELRRRTRRPQSELNPVEELEETLPGGKTPEELWIENIRNQNLARSLASLNPDQLEAIKMKDFEQLGYAEIAEAMGIGLSAAKMRVQRARLALQKAYNELEAEG